jgi:RND family efflux transporter MFP subunit
VAQAQAAARTAAVVRDYATIQAPSDGYVVKRLVAPGVLAQPGTAVLKLTQIDRVRLQANVGEKDLPGIKVGGRVAVATTTGGTAVDVRVTSVFPFVDAGARTAVVEAVIDNVERRFLPGQYVTMRFVTGERPDAITVARGAVARLGGKATVWVVSEDRAEPHAVVTGLEGPERIEIVTGLSERERVVARGHEALYAGARIADVSAGPVSAQPPGDTPGTEAKAKGGAHGGH